MAPASGRKKQDAGKPSPSIQKPSRALTPLQKRLQSRLSSAHFRMLNESLYTSSSAHCHNMLRRNPSLFHVYHQGFSNQVSRWPSNPLDDVIKYLCSQPASLRVADLGCGEARLAKEIPQKKVWSFDLVAVNDKVTACDIANLPLEEDQVDMAVFCLSLMGTNYKEFLKEARRVVKHGGMVLVAEVASRFKGHDPSEFVEGVSGMGFEKVDGHPFVTRGKKGKGKKKKRNKQKDEKEVGSAFFFKFAFKCVKKQLEKDEGDGGDSLPKLLPCLYKKR